MSDPSPTRILIEDRLGEPVEAFVKARRPIRVPSWRELAAEIAEKTGVAVTDETLRSWASESERAA